MSGLEGSWKDKIAFVRKGTQESGTVELMQRLGFDAVPAVIVLDARGREVARFVGLRSANEIETLLKKATAP